MSAMGGSKQSHDEKDVDFDLVLNGQIASFDNMFDGKTEHAENAIDFSDEDELAEEEEEEPTQGQTNKNVPDEEDFDIFGENEDEEEEKQEEEEEEEEEDDDFMKELQQEAMEGVEQEDETEAVTGAVFGLSLPNNAGLQDLDFASNSMLDATKQIGDSDIELSDEDEVINNKETESTKEKLTKEEILKLQEEKKRELIEKNRKNREKLIKIFYPTFKNGKPMKLQKLFPIVPLDFNYQQPPPIIKPLLPRSIHFEVEDDKGKEFKMSTKKIKEKNKLINKSNQYMPDVKIIKIDKINSEKSSESLTSKKKKIETISYDTNLIISTAEWNDDEIFNASENIEILPPAKRLKIEDNILDAWQDDDEMIFEGNMNLELINLKLDMNDPNLIFIDKHTESKLLAKNINSDAMIPSNQKLLEAKFHISNDIEYEPLKANYQTKIRATIGTLNIEHTPPAIRLQSPFYKVKPTDKENRIYHRPRFNVKTNITIYFSKPKIRKKKKDKGKEVSELFNKTTDLTLGDTAPFFISEYSEEYPLSLSKFGMGSKVINYYRKRSEDDNTRPKLSVGETHVLGVQDRSPFWNFGSIEKGSIVPTLYNKLVRAPLFHHEPFSTDFLLVKSSGGGGNGQRFYLRPINYMFTVGQTLPATEVPGPHSRRATAIMKHRLKMIAFRALNLNDKTRITVKDISEHFPQQSDMQIRQRLKEFMEYQRGGADQGFWRLKNADKLPNFDQIRRMMSPEDVCLLEVMMWGQQKFEDVDIFRRERLQAAVNDENNNTNNISNNKKDKDGNSEETLSQQLAPWNTTRNFIQATQGKAMLQIYGEGDPSKIGEAVSFLKISMKGGFIKNVESKDSKPNTPGASQTNNVTHSYNVAVQQKLYDEQISKVWFKQATSLSKYRNTDKPRIVELAELSDHKLMQKANKAVDEEVNEKPRYLRITRMVKNAYGIKERKVQIIKDPKVVELYVKKKQEQLLETSGSADINAVVVTNDEEENMKVKKRLEEELAKLQKQAEKKKKKQSGITAANIDSEGRISGKGIGKGKSTSRRCATCGSLGHIRTNKTCPLYFTVHNKSNPNYIPGSEVGAELLKQQGLEAPQTASSSSPGNPLPSSETQ
jgi:transcription initiation factor TFIID subunit 1